MPDMVKKISGGISRALMWFASAGLIAMTVVISWQVFTRYVLNQSPPWSEQAALLIMNWMVMSAAAAGVREGFHIRMSFAADNAPEKLQLPIRVLAHGVVAFVGVTFFLWGGELVLRTWSHVIPTLDLPRGVAYLPFPLAGVAIAFFSLEKMIDEFGEKGAGR